MCMVTAKKKALLVRRAFVVSLAHASHHRGSFPTTTAIIEIM